MLIDVFLYYHLVLKVYIPHRIGHLFKVMLKLLSSSYHKPILTQLQFNYEHTPLLTYSTRYMDTIPQYRYNSIIHNTHTYFTQFNVIRLNKHDHHHLVCDTNI